MFAFFVGYLAHDFQVVRIDCPGKVEYVLSCAAGRTSKRGYKLKHQDLLVLRQRCYLPNDFFCKWRWSHWRCLRP